MKDYYKIGEISKIYGISRDSLMYYEKLGVLTPVRDSNGYRLYTTNDIWKLNLVKELRTFNFPIKKIKEYMINRSVNSTQEMLSQEISLIDNKIQELTSLKENVIKRLENINLAENLSELNTIKISYIKERKALKLNAKISSDEEIDYMIKELQRKHEDNFYLLGNTKVGAIYNLNSLKNGVFTQYQAVFCLLDNNEPDYNLLFPEGYYITLSFKGSYSLNQQHLSNLFDFIKKNNYKIISAPIEIYKIDIHETSLEEEFITEIQIPISL